jgi:prevent-host-death family protein
MKQWQLQEAKAKFSEVVRSATTDGPQAITLHGKAVVVILSKAQYEKLRTPKMTLVEMMNKSPLKGINIEFERNPSFNRDIDL